jgi:hypothetical protein
MELVGERTIRAPGSKQPSQEPMSGIGLLNERSLHASLKAWYSQPGDRFEVPVDGYVVDIVRDEVLLEIQTGNFSAIKSKLATLVSSHQVRLIYPIAMEKWVVRAPADGAGAGSRICSARP